MDMTAFKALRVLHIAADLSGPAIAMIKWLTGSLESMSRASSLEEITICLEADNDLVIVLPVESGILQVSRCFWDFNTVLAASGRFSKLANFALYICSLDEEQTLAAQASLRSHLPGLSTHEILHVIPTTMFPEELQPTM